MVEWDVYISMYMCVGVFMCVLVCHYACVCADMYTKSLFLSSFQLCKWKNVWEIRRERESELYNLLLLFVFCIWFFLFLSFNVFAPFIRWEAFSPCRCCLFACVCVCVLFVFLGKIKQKKSIFLSPCNSNLKFALCFVIEGINRNNTQKSGKLRAKAWFWNIFFGVIVHPLFWVSSPSFCSCSWQTCRCCISKMSDGMFHEWEQKKHAHTLCPLFVQDQRMGKG